MAQLFETDITLLLKLSGHIPADVEPEALPEPPQATTETLRRISEADMPPRMKELLREYRDLRLKEERGRVYSLIDAFENSSESLRDPGTWLTAVLETSLPDHLVKVFVTFSVMRQPQGWRWPAELEPSKDG